MIVSIFRIYIFFVVGKAFFLDGSIVNIVTIRQFKVCLSVCLNICLGCKWRKQWCKVTNFRYAFKAYILRSTIKIVTVCLLLFTRPHKNLFWIFVQPFFLNECFHEFFFLNSVERVLFSWWYYFVQNVDGIAIPQFKVYLFKHLFGLRMK